MDAVFGNVGTIITFRVGAEDAEFLEKWFQPDFMMNDIVNLGKYTVYLKLMINGISSRGFSADMLRPFSQPERSNREAIIAFSRETYGTPREVVQKEIADWAGSGSEEVVVEEKREYKPIRRFDSPPPQRRDDRPFDRNSRDARPPRRNNFQQSRPPQNNPNIKPFDQTQGRPKEASLSALSSAPVDFRGRRMENKPKENKPKKEVDTSELKKILEETLGKKEE